jgi:Cdc6-like AAA superfamily ATPase
MQMILSGGQTTHAKIINKRIDVDIDNLTTQERLKMLYSIYVAHPDAERILQKIERCHYSREYSSEPRSMSLTGATGSGKSTLIEQYMLRHPATETEKETSIPIFKSIIQPNTNIRDFVISVLKSLIASVSGIREDDVHDDFLKGNLTTVRKRLYKYIAHAKVKIIILDEFQHLISSKSKKVLNDIADTIKTLINETKVPVILVGTTKANAVFAENPELARRLSEKIDLTPFSISDPSSMTTYRKFLAEVDKLLPFQTLSRLATKEMSMRMYAASNGYIDDIMRIVHDAGYTAIYDGAESITIEHLAQAFENNPGQNQTAPGNPFSASYENLQNWRCITDAATGKSHNSSLRNSVPADISDIF